MKEVLRCPKDEENWGKLQKLRDVILLVTQGIRTFVLESAEDAAELAGAVLRGPDVDDNHYTSIGTGTWIPPGSRLYLEKHEAKSIKDKVRYDARRDFLVDRIRAARPDTQIQVLTRPFGTHLSPPVDPFVKVLADERNSLNVCAHKAKPQLPQNDPHAILDYMLLVLWDALFLDQCIGWTQQNVTNLTVDRTLELGRYFRLGLEVGEEGIFTGLCAMHSAANISCVSRKGLVCSVISSVSRIGLACVDKGMIQNSKVVDRSKAFVLIVREFTLRPRNKCCQCNF